MRAPDLWWQPPGVAAALLAPLAAVYGAVAARRLGRPGPRGAVPVVCVGNVTVGGAGKTPSAIAIAALAAAAGRAPAFLTRGYGGRLAGPIRVDPTRHGAADVGDEALLLARHAPTFVARNRPDGAAMAVSEGAELVVMDDGLQNPSLAKDLAIAVFDGRRGVGNGLCLPAGPLRAPLARQWPLIDAVLIMGEGLAGTALAADARARGVPVIHATLEPDRAGVDRLHGRRVLAFSGIGDPAKFERTCREAGLVVEANRSFPDHHPYTAADLARLLDEAERTGLVPVTTEKDRVRLTRHADAEPRLGLVQTLPVSARFTDPEAVTAILDRYASRRTGIGRPSRFSTASGEA